jgi:hypothetical protein
LELQRHIEEFHPTKEIDDENKNKVKVSFGLCEEIGTLNLSIFKKCC